MLYTLCIHRIATNTENSAPHGLCTFADPQPNHAFITALPSTQSSSHSCCFLDSIKIALAGDSQWKTRTTYISFCIGALVICATAYFRTEIVYCERAAHHQATTTFSVPPDPGHNDDDDDARRLLIPNDSIVCVCMPNLNVTAERTRKCVKRPRTS